MVQGEKLGGVTLVLPCSFVLPWVPTGGGTVLCHLALLVSSYTKYNCCLLVFLLFSVSTISECLSSVRVLCLYLSLEKLQIFLENAH